MFSFFRKSQDSKKVTVPEREADGFVIVGDTADDQSRESKDKTLFPETRPMYNKPPQHTCYSKMEINTGHRSQLTVSSAEVGNERSPNLESSPFMSDLLSDIPFALAPHVLAVQGAHNDVPDRLLTYDINDNLSRFWYDFTLENSVLCDP
ncbi:UBAP1-MVB12-associated (UMA)-domain containing protein 1 [Dromaius novaehollandiae]|uniref:UBAP1-MVB12-associated (UMA)-domain containing protein 1 n=1 Tax=Dromaius novaehollandiae TaxID=8790 RepID=UPI000E1F35CA|nr:UBAP1-MVB12-associated (UMA)-domain containing protein 1 isoform X3 [Dromaius novaehollandiae]XP_025955285.1 UBAP1-MVB12-associated (UMA)-domain containing protein 1 isoform X3 [Dromaius novaehollandiae]XP_025955286.1 UBAP1-MVB12-associated (UMA)-domain containing protein 1 isoform X3 [Dromaius novaehollandiae]XP_025955287.1 UBAP1-MVB12-associated (UMA)-domain containing protein 1 isoform X3 [Dromaius novaehollandiae]